MIDDVVQAPKAKSFARKEADTIGEDLIGEVYATLIGGASNSNVGGDVNH
jgi:hypothetical protein